MSISVELTPAQIEKIQRDVVSQLTAKLLTEVFASFNVKQLAGEVKNDVIRQAASKIATELKDKYRESEIIHRALQSAESQVYSQITEKLKNGITVRFGSDA